MSDAELDAMIEREQLTRRVMLPIAGLLIFGWVAFNGAPQPSERFDTSPLAGCYWSQLGLGLRLDVDRLYLLPGDHAPIAYGISREKVGLTIVPEAVITIDPEGPAFRVANRKDSPWIPNLTLRRFAPEARYTVIDIAKANGFTMLGERDAKSVDFRRDPSCER
ncbi:MAG TPA: hypothetical protein VEZ59_07840 [Sphingopyxis sp.]|nr:hypothetical protein [Sphingopyxis sp.]